jgi:hypothetical protein
MKIMFNLDPLGALFDLDILGLLVIGRYGVEDFMQASSFRSFAPDHKYEIFKEPVRTAHQS